MDIIVASDVIFARELHDGLSSLLVDLLKISTAHSPEAFIACTVRADGMVQGFLKVSGLKTCQKHFYTSSARCFSSREQRARD